MDSFLIDFNSPKNSRENAPLIPESLARSPFTSSAPMLFSSSQTDSNPFDMVECQVAANTADENDPFEMVLNNAINCQENNLKENEVKTFVPETSNDSPELPQADAISISQSLPDLRNLPGAEILSEIPSTVESHEPKYPCLLKNGVKPSASANLAAWNCLEDIPPPDSLLNSTVDMSCFLDDTLSTSIINVANLKDTSVLFEEHSSPVMAKTPSPVLKESHKATFKSDEELRLLAQKKIENIINKAEKDIQSDIEESLVQRRRSIQSLSNPSQEILALCTPRKQNLKTDQPTWSLEKWSENELKKLDLILPDTSSNSTSSRNESALAAYLNLPSLKLEESIFLSSLKLSTPGAINKPTPQPVTPVKYASENNSAAEKDSTKNMLSVPSSSMSPTLLPLPLCEEAVRNLTLCSKYSPPYKNSIDQHKIDNTQKVIPDSSREQAKLTLRKSTVPSKTQSKMAPMKATAPVQNMTRIRSSLLTASKPIASTVSGRKSMLKETVPKPATTQTANSKSLRMTQSPSRSLSGSLPNLSSQGSKPTTKLPSPRRSGSASSPYAPVNLKKRFESGKEKSSNQISSSFHHSPRPLRKSSPCRTGSQTRVLAEINTVSSARMSPKCRLNLSETPRRARSMLTEKENYV